MTKVVVVGGGAAGMMAAIAAARHGARVVLLEKTGKLGFKIQISGGGRCNITNDLTDARELVSMFPGNGKFLQDALRRFTKDDVLEILARHGIQTKVEPPYGKVFPKSDRAQDVVRALETEMRELGVEIRLHAPVARIGIDKGHASGVELAKESQSAGSRGPAEPMSEAPSSRPEPTPYLAAEAVVVATGGLSFPRSGSTGDGYAMAQDCGHRVVPQFPSLVPLRVAGTRELSGVALRGVEGRTLVGGKQAGPAFMGDMLFTHFGLSGPVVLQLSRAAAEGLYRGEKVEVRFDLAPDRSPEDIEGDLLEQLSQASRQLVTSILPAWLPRSAIGAFTRSAGVDEERRCADVTRLERKALVRTLKGWSFAVSGWHSFEGAEVTCGGIDLREIDPRTFESKKISGLYFAGEVLDVDGYVGGYNLQAAWSSGWLAGQAAARDFAINSPGLAPRRVERHSRLSDD